MNWHGQFMLRAMQKKRSTHLYVGGTLRQDLPLDSIGTENHFGVAPALENLVVHFLVTPLVPALSTRGIGDEFSAGTAADWIEFHGAAFQGKFSMNGG